MLRTIQKLIADWVIRCFGFENMMPRMRALRLLEEAVEFAQSVDINEEDAHKIVMYVFSRPPGSPMAELGGVLVTTLAAAEALGVPAEHLLEEETRRILNKTLTHFAEREQRKKEAGLL